MEIKIDSRFAKKVQGMFGKYEFQVGVLKDGAHRYAKVGKRGMGGKDVLGTYAGGPVRKKGYGSSLSISQVSKANRERLGVNFYTAPFESDSKSQKDILAFTKAFFDLVFGRSQQKRAENLLQAVVRNPILRGEYGSQSPITTKIKGFNRPMIDTAQLFKAITSKCRVKRV